MNTSKPIACIIPARYGSTRLPGKPLAEIDGLPLVMWVYNSAKLSGVFESVVVATDDDRIAAAVERHGGRAVMTSANHRRGTDRVLEAAEKQPCPYVVNLQGDEPEIPAEVLKLVASNIHAIDDNTLLTVASHATIVETANPNVVKVVLNAKGEALYFSRSRIPYDTGNGENGCYLKHKGIYAFTMGGLRRYCSFPEGELERRESLEQLRALEYGMGVRCIVHDFESRGIDTPQDLAAFRDRGKTRPFVR